MSTTTIQPPYQFAFHDRVSSTPPHCTMWDRLVEGNLTRDQKNNIFHALRTNSGFGSSSFKQGGWAFPFGQFMKTYLVKYSYDSGKWAEIKAFDKTCIRSSFYTNDSIVQIIEMPTK